MPYRIQEKGKMLLKAISLHSKNIKHTRLINSITCKRKHLILDFGVNYRFKGINKCSSQSAKLLPGTECRKSQFILINIFTGNIQKVSVAQKHKLSESRNEKQAKSYIEKKSVVIGITTLTLAQNMLCCTRISKKTSVQYIYTLVHCVFIYFYSTD